MQISRRGSIFVAVRRPATGIMNISTKPAGESAMPGQLGRVAEAALQKFRNQHGGTEQHHAQTKEKNTAVPKLRFFSRRTSTMGLG